MFEVVTADGLKRALAGKACASPSATPPPDLCDALNLPDGMVVLQCQHNPEYRAGREQAAGDSPGFVRCSMNSSSSTMEREPRGFWLDLYGLRGGWRARGELGGWGGEYCSVRAPSLFQGSKTVPTGELVALEEGSPLNLAGITSAQEQRYRSLILDVLNLRSPRQGRADHPPISSPSRESWIALLHRDPFGASPLLFRRNVSLGFVLLVVV